VKEQNLDRHPRTVVLPFCHIALKAPKPPSLPYPRELNTLGNHLRKRRLDLKLTQKDVAEKLGVDKTTVQFWENNRVKPSLRLIPKIIEFLGYDPYETIPMSLGEEIITFRRRHGFSQKKLAHLLGIDLTTICSWERGKNQPSKRLLDRLNSLFTCFNSTVSAPQE
jgi:transcriptional regulator with XRE-family HTH domain